MLMKYSHEYTCKMKKNILDEKFIQLLRNNYNIDVRGDSAEFQATTDAHVGMLQSQWFSAVYET